MRTDLVEQAQAIRAGMQALARTAPDEVLLAQPMAMYDEWSADGVAYMHAREAAPQAGFFKVGMANPLPVDRIVEFSKKYKRCVCVEEGDPYLNTLLLAAGANVEKRDEKWRFGEFNSDRAFAPAF